MGKQYELKLFLKLSQNGHKSCYCPVDILEMECIIVRAPSVGRQERHTFFLPSLFSNPKSYENKNQNCVPDHKFLFIENETGTCNNKICII